MSVISLLVTFMVCLVCEAVPSSSTLSHFQPMIAIVCAGKNRYHNQYLDENKRWISDPDPKATCFKDKLEILEYCRKVYPKRDIRNIVEYSKYMPIDNWCRVGQSCGYRRFVKPYRCLEGPFQSDALLVPAYCLFDHIHNGSLCQSSDYWNKTATASCVEKRAMQLKSFGMLLPCGVGIFSGVEFVCCPSNMAPTENTAKDTHIGMFYLILYFLTKLQGICNYRCLRIKHHSAIKISLFLRRHFYKLLLKNDLVE